MYFYFRYVNKNEHFDVIYLKKNSFVVRVGKTCTDAIALYIHMEKKIWGKKKYWTKYYIHQTRL